MASSCPSSVGFTARDGALAAGDGVAGVVAAGAGVAAGFAAFVAGAAIANVAARIENEASASARRVDGRWSADADRSAERGTDKSKTSVTRADGDGPAHRVPARSAAQYAIAVCPTHPIYGARRDVLPGRGEGLRLR